MWHQGDEGCRDGEMREVRQDHLRIGELGLELRLPVVRKLQEIIQQSDLMHDLHGRWVNGVSPEVAEKIRVLLENRDVHSGACQQEARHHAGWPAACDAAGCIQDFGHLQSPPVKAVPMPAYVAGLNLTLIQAASLSLEGKVRRKRWQCG